MKRIPVLSVFWKRRLRTRSTHEKLVGCDNEPRKKDIESAEVSDQTASEPLGRELGLISRLIGCSHKEMGRPFTDGRMQYRSCVSCGARRRFNAETFETFGKFYVPPASISDL
jgi:hypothetical protein